MPGRSCWLAITPSRRCDNFLYGFKGAPSARQPTGGDSLRELDAGNALGMPRTSIDAWRTWTMEAEGICGTVGGGPCRRKDPGAPPRTPALSQRWVLTRSSPRPARQSPTPEPPGHARARYARPYGHTLARPGEPGAARRVPDRGDDLPDTLRERIDGASRTATTRVTCRSGHGSARTSWAGRGRQIGAAMACPAGKGSI